VRAITPTVLPPSPPPLSSPPSPCVLSGPVLAEHCQKRQGAVMGCLQLGCPRARAAVPGDRHASHGEPDRVSPLVRTRPPPFSPGLGSTTRAQPIVFAAAPFHVFVSCFAHCPLVHVVIFRLSRIIVTILPDVASPTCNPRHAIPMSSHTFPDNCDLCVAVAMPLATTSYLL